MKVTESAKLPGLLVLEPDVHEDFRGDYVMTYNEKLYGELGVKAHFVEHCISTSRKGVLRGLHADPACDKLIMLHSGTIYYVVADMERLLWEAFILSGENHRQVFKPARYAAGFLALTDGVCFQYYQSQYYDPARQKTYSWRDSELGIYWPYTGWPTLSERDNIPSTYLWSQ